MAKAAVLPAPSIASKEMHTRGYLEPTGPPTLSFHPAAFSLEAEAMMKRVGEFQALMKAELKSCTPKEREVLVKRCSVSDVKDQVDKIYSNRAFVIELTAWHDEQLFSQATDREEVDEMDDGEVAAARAKKYLEPGVADLLHEINTSPLSMVRHIKDRSHFLRKTKTPDYNTLSHLRASHASHPGHHLAPSTLTNIVITITFQPIPRYSNRVPFPPRVQTMVVLGSTTLYEMRENFLAGGEAIPAEFTDDEEGEDIPDEEAYKLRSARRKRWHAERRVTGSVWGINGVLYPDIGEGKKDYAKLVMGLIDETLWQGKGKLSKRSSQQQQQQNDEQQTQRSNSFGLTNGSLDLDVHHQTSRRTGSTISQTQLPATPSDRGENERDDARDEILSGGAPEWKIGTAMQDTRIGDLEIKVGEPYWFMHQGNCEHVWIVDSIRHVHPSDPVPESSDFSYPYPITTFLSRLAAAKCRICDRDPGSVITIDDELAAESPALMCLTCFEMLHGDNKDGHVIVIPNLAEM